MDFFSLFAFQIIQLGVCIREALELAGSWFFFRKQICQQGLGMLHKAVAKQFQVPFAQDLPSFQF